MSIFFDAFAPCNKKTLFSPFSVKIKNVFAKMKEVVLFPWLPGNLRQDTRSALIGQQQGFWQIIIQREKISLFPPRLDFFPHP